MNIVINDQPAHTSGCHLLSVVQAATNTNPALGNSHRLKRTTPDILISEYAVYVHAPTSRQGAELNSGPLGAWWLDSRQAMHSIRQCSDLPRRLDDRLYWMFMSVYLYSSLFVTNVNKSKDMVLGTVTSISTTSFLLYM